MRSRQMTVHALICYAHQTFKSKLASERYRMVVAGVAPTHNIKVPSARAEISLLIYFYICMLIYFDLGWTNSAAPRTSARNPGQRSDALPQAHPIRHRHQHKRRGMNVNYPYPGIIYNIQVDLDRSACDNLRVNFCQCLYQILGRPPQTPGVPPHTKAVWYLFNAFINKLYITCFFQCNFICRKQYRIQL